MARVLNRTDKRYLLSVHTPDYPVGQWIINPDVSAVDTWPTKYWIITGDVVTLMDQAARDAVDAAEATANTLENRGQAESVPDDTTEIGMQARAGIEVFNKRDNYLTNRVEELQDHVRSLRDAIENSSGAAQNIRDAVAAVNLNTMATQTRPRADAIQDYKDEIAAGNVDG